MAIKDPDLDEQDVDYGEHGNRVGESHPLSKLSNADVERMRFFYEEGGWSEAQIVRVFGQPRRTVRDILSYTTRATTPVQWREPRKKRSDNR